MSLTKEDYISRLGGALQDAAEELQPDDKLRNLDQAVSVYSKDRPRIKVHTADGDGTSYDFAMPSDWEENFSFLKTPIEYPYGDDYQSPQILLSEDWRFYRKLVNDVTTLYIRFLTFIPASGKTIKYDYTIPHTFGDTTNTIKDADADAVLNLAAAFCFWALAAKFAQSSDPSIDADVIDHQRKSDLYNELGNNRLTYYRAQLGIGDEAKNKAVATAGVSIKEYDIKRPGGSDFLTHPARYR